MSRASLFLPIKPGLKAWFLSWALKRLAGSWFYEFDLGLSAPPEAGGQAWSAGRTPSGLNRSRKRFARGEFGKHPFAANAQGVDDLLGEIHKQRLVVAGRVGQQAGQVEDGA